MKLLIVSDTEDAGLWDYYSPGKLAGIDAILACGDLKADYLSFLVTMGSIPVFYVHGNHDTGYVQHPPEGCECVDGKLIRFKGYRILGLGGCMRYRPGAPHQYTDREMRARVHSLWRQLWKNKGFDILLTHAAAQGLGDMDDICHQGFPVFRELIDRYHPLYHCHGHVHLGYDMRLPRADQYNDTVLVNATGKYVIELPDRER